MACAKCKDFFALAALLAIALSPVLAINATEPPKAPTTSISQLPGNVGCGLFRFRWRELKNYTLTPEPELKTAVPIELPDCKGGIIKVKSLPEDKSVFSYASNVPVAVVSVAGGPGSRIYTTEQGSMVGNSLTPPLRMNPGRPGQDKNQTASYFFPLRAAHFCYICPNGTLPEVPEVPEVKAPPPPQQQMPGSGIFDALMGLVEQVLGAATASGTGAQLQQQLVQAWQQVQATPQYQQILSSPAVQQLLAAFSGQGQGQGQQGVPMNWQQLLVQAGTAVVQAFNGGAQQQPQQQLQQPAAQAGRP